MNVVKRKHLKMIRPHSVNPQYISRQHPRQQRPTYRKCRGSAEKLLKISLKQTQLMVTKCKDNTFSTSFKSQLNIF